MNYILVKMFIAVSLAQCVKSQPTVYVSKVSGNDSTNCGSQYLPCRTISHAIYKASSGSTIYLDGTNTIQDPFKCQPLTSHHRGIYVNKNISFVGIWSRAYIACDAEQNWIVNGTNGSSPLNVNLTGLVFVNSRVHFIETSVAVKQCVFSKTEEVVMNFTMLYRNTFGLLLDEVTFDSNEACVSVASYSANSEQNQIHIDIRNSVFKSNGLRPFPKPFSLQSTVVWLDCAKTNFVHIKIKNTSFHENFVREDGMMYLKNELGQTNILLEDTEFVENGQHDTRAANSLFVLWCQNVVIHIGASRVFKSLARFLSISAGSTQISVSSTIIDDFINSRVHGGVFFIESNTVNLLIENSLFVNGRSNPGHGGVVYISAQNSSVLIRNCNFSSITTTYKGGVLYTSAPAKNQNDSALILFMTNSTFTSNSAVYGGVIHTGSPLHANIIITANGCRFLSNKVRAAGGVMWLLWSISMNIQLFNTHFQSNVAPSRGGVLYTPTSPRKGSSFRLSATDVTFLHNHASGPGGVMNLQSIDDISLYFRSVSFEQNFSKSGPGGAFFVSLASEGGNASLFNLTAIDVCFTDNTAGPPGGALYLELKLKSAVLRFEKVSFINNSATGAPAGAMYLTSDQKSYASIDLSGCNFVGNTAATVGGAIYAVARGTFVSNNSIFQSNVAHSSPGGALCLQMANSSVIFANTTFLENSSPVGPGGAMYLEISKDSSVGITSCSFTNNTAPRAFGGAVFIKMSDDLLNQSGCEESSLVHPAPWRSWIYNNTVLMQNTYFEGNIATAGGALSVTNGAARFRNCTFINNFASVQGAHISNDGSNSLQLLDSVFIQTVANVSVGENGFHLASFVQTYSAGPFVLVNSTVDQRTRWNADPLIMVSKGGFVDFDNFSSVVCPPGSVVSKLNLSYPNRVNNTCTFQVTVLRLWCEECNPGFYSLQRGHTKGLTTTMDFACLPCPSGADCLPSIKSKPNFWGYMVQSHPPALNFTLCPLAYCRSPKQESDVYNSCHGHRQGFMCGECAPGYTETLFSTECRLAKDCKDRWFWFASVALVLIIALFLIFKPPIVTFAVKQILWFRTFFPRMEHRGIENRENALNSLNEDIGGEQESRLLLSTEEIEYEKSQAVGFLEIVFYFYQISNLLLTSTSAEELVKNKVILPVVGFFNFQQRFSNGGFVCPFAGLSPQTKKLLEVAPVVGTFVAICFIYSLHRILCWILKTTAPRYGPYVRATMETLLLGYARVANVSLSLVQCVPIGSKSRWFYNGTIVCFQWWQYVLVCFNVIVVVPFMFALAWGSVKLHYGKISVKQLLLASICPLPFLVLWLVRFIRREVNVVEQSDYSETLKEVLHEPFRKPETGSKGGLYWESVLIGRRFVLVLFYCFITDPSLRLLCMSFVCVLAGLHHSMVKPFRNPHANTAESVSLLSLVLLAIINMYKSVIMATERQIKGPNVAIFQVFDWIEILLLGFLPAVFVLIITLAMLSLAMRVLFALCRLFYKSITAPCVCSAKPNDRDPLLNVTDETCR